MKIVSWNCNGALRNKFATLNEIKADIYIVQECENPTLTNSPEYKKWSKNHLWLGDNKNKGIGIFAKQSIKLDRLPWTNEYKDHTVKHFLPCRVNSNFDLLAVWTHKNNSPNFGYIGQFWKYLQVNSNKFENIIIAGDFNSNVIWDQWDRWWNHSDVVKQLRNQGIESLYHLNSGELQGKETKPTFFLQRKLEKPYHIDYFFGSKKFQKELSQLTIGNIEKWLEISDHLPLTAEFIG